MKRIKTGWQGLPRIYQALCFILLVMFILIVAFPGKAPFRDILPPFTYFNRFFQQHKAYVHHSLADSNPSVCSVLQRLIEDPTHGGRGLDDLVDAACDENAFITPLMDAFLLEWGYSDEHVRKERSPQEIMTYLANPRGIRYGGERADEIQRWSAANWKRFSPRLKAHVAGLYAVSVDPALAFNRLRDKIPPTIPQALEGEACSQAQLLPAKIREQMALADKLDFGPAWTALLPYCHYLDELLLGDDPLLRSSEPEPIPGDDWFPRGILYASQTPFGVVAVGGSQDNLYPAGDLFLLIDLGGDDRYFFDETFCPPEKGGKPSHCSTLVDLDGNDSYTGGTGPVAAGVLGFGALLDLHGDDQYEAGQIALGAGFMGAGFLVDREGKDTYSATRFGQGAGFHGVGLLMDGGGDDLYLGAALCQGFSGPRGMGVLVEDAGDDLLVCTPGEDQDGLCFAQGCSASFYPDQVGGLGLIINLSGDDSYRCGSLGQGAADGKGIGLLLDLGGYDFFNGWNQCQGFGSSGGVGLLRDLQGNDHFLARNGSQGMGEAGSLGFLVDDQGNDHYTALDRSQGKNSRNGTGMLSDRKGRDRFLSQSLK